ncbi:hypothetical protein Tco_0903451 [Tanacetum coccineum]
MLTQSFTLNSNNLQPLTFPLRFLNSLTSFGYLRYLEDEGVKWLTRLFNKIFPSAKMPDEWRLSEVIPIYKNKGDAETCSNYRGIKLLSHTMKLWERVIERRVRRETRVRIKQKPQERRLIPGKLEHKNGRARKEPGIYELKGQTWSTFGQP